MVWPRAAAEAPSPRQQASAGLGRRACSSLAQACLAREQMAGGRAEPLSSRFARLRARAAHRDFALAAPRPEEWLPIEWPEGEEKPAKYWLSALPKNISFRKLVDRTKPRWRIERDYREQTGRRARTFRRTRMARFPPPRHAAHRGLRVPALRAGDDSPLRTSCRRALPEA